MRPQGSPEELERRRRRGIELLKAGASVTEVARRLGCSHSSVILWREAVRRRGLKALTAKPAPGRPSKLTAAQQRQLPRLLLRGATTWKFDTDLWTTGRIATVIHRTFGVRLHRAHVGRLLTTLGWSCQKPERRAVERDDVAIARWKRYRWVAVKKLGAPERPSGVPRRMWLPVDSQRPAHLGAPRPHADHPASVSPRQSLGDLGGDCERPAAALRALHPFLSGEQPHPYRGRGLPARLAPPAPRARHRPLGRRQHSQGSRRSRPAHPVSAVARRALPGLCARPEPGRVRLDPLQGHARQWSPRQPR